MRENLLLDLMEFKDWDLTKQFAVARSKVKQFYGLAFLPNLPAPRWNRSFKILLPLTESFPNFQLPPPPQKKKERERIVSKNPKLHIEVYFG